MVDGIENSHSKILIANPGTGKTTAISKQVATLIKSGVSPSEILCLTFTVKATEEMVRKVREQCIKLEISESQIGEVEVSTFHSFALKYISDSEVSPKIAGNNLLRYSILKSAYRHRPFNYSNSFVSSNIVPEIENSIRYVKSFGILPPDVDEDAVSTVLSGMWRSQRFNQTLSTSALSVYFQFFLNSYKEYEELKHGNLIDYNDILLEYLKLPSEDKKVYKYVMVDELQDVNDVQARIIEEAGRIKFLVGDRKQSIFGFQGGSLSVFKKFVENSAYEKEIMGENHRSTEEILDYARSFFRNVEDSDVYEDELNEFISEGKHGETVHVMVAESPIVSGVNKVRNLQKSLLSGQRIALITRTNDQLVQASRLLDEHKIPYTSTAPPAISVEAKNDLLNFLSGIFSDDTATILNALFTPFSGIPLKQAFSISSGVKSRKVNASDLPSEAKEFYAIREKVKSSRDLDAVFTERIIPASVPLGRDYTLTILSLRDSINEFFAESRAPDFSDLSDYLTVSEEQYEPPASGENLILSTVHKAKGLEFDHVIYVPSRRNERTSFIDAVTRAVIDSVTGIDVETELSGEDDRVDFVAFTRARDTLTVICDERQRTRYSIDKFCTTEYSDEKNVRGLMPFKYDEAYSLFVAGNYDGAKKMLDSNWSWIRDEIRDYFRRLSHISFSAIEGIEYPMDFLLQNILKVPSTSYPLLFGSRVHEIAQGIFEDKEVEIDTPELSQIKENINAIIWTVQNTMSMQRAYAEKRLFLDVSTVFSEFNSYKGVKIMAFLDAVFKSKSGERFLIVDYKTDMSQRNGAKHRRQLLFYRALLSRYLSVPEEDIETAIAYVSLREPINTGSIDYYLDDRKPSVDALETVKRKMARFFDFKDDPDKFIDFLLTKKGSYGFNGGYTTVANSILSYLQS